MTGTDLPSNWGRWGVDDQLGTLNLIGADAARRAAGEVRTGRHVSLARPTTPVPLTTGFDPIGSPATMPAGVAQIVNFGGFRPMAITDSLLINTHNAALTHLDALVHIPTEDGVYPGVAPADAVSPTGVRHGSADGFGAGIVTRGVLLDLPGDAGSLDADRRVTGADLQDALGRTGTSLEPGDALAVRGGWDADIPIDQPAPGLDLSAVAWLHDKDVSVYLGDIGDPRPPSPPLPVHQVALARLGLPLVDAAALDDLAAVCRAERRWSFMLVLAPPRITGTTGLVVNPVAVL